MYTKEDELSHHWRMETDRLKTEDEYGMQVKALICTCKYYLLIKLNGIIISSVVPPIMFSLEGMCKKYFNIKPLIVGPGVKTGLNIKYENPSEVGADRIVNAVAAIHEYGSPLIIVDFGTATTYCYINEKSIIWVARLHRVLVFQRKPYIRAVKLPRIEITRPESVIGKNTVSAMQSGIVYGYVGQVEGIVKRMKE